MFANSPWSRAASGTSPDRTAGRVPHCPTGFADNGPDRAAPQRRDIPRTTLRLGAFGIDLHEVDPLDAARREPAVEGLRPDTNGQCRRKEPAAIIGRRASAYETPLFPAHWETKRRRPVAVLVPERLLHKHDAMLEAVQPDVGRELLEHRRIRLEGEHAPAFADEAGGQHREIAVVRTDVGEDAPGRRRWRR